MKKKKHSFSMSELLVCMTIIAIVVSMAIPSIKAAQSSYTSLTYFAFDTLKQLVRAMYTVSSSAPLADSSGNLHDKDDVLLTTGCRMNDDDKTEIQRILRPDVYGETESSYNGTNVLNLNCSSSYNGYCIYNNDPSKQIAKPTGGYTQPYCNTANFSDTGWRAAELSQAKGSFNFCKRMAELMSTSGTVNCEDNLKYVSYYNVASPYPALGEDDSGVSTLDADKYNFILTNGQRVYVSRRECNNEISKDVCFRLVGIDLNGSKGPNIASPRMGETTDDNKNKIPDIVTFMIMDNGIIFPLGVAADNKKIGSKTQLYLNSKTLAYNYAEDGKTSDTIKCTYATGKGACKYVVDTLDADGNSGGAAGSYREKFCVSGDPRYKYYTKYCSITVDGINSSAYTIAPKCPGGSGNEVYAECHVEPIKPMLKK